MLSETNAGIEKYTYDAFGQPKITDWAGNVRTDSAYGNRFMFTGREFLSTLGIYDYRNRAYHPGLGRFLQTDPIGFAAGDQNLFRYVGNNPANNVDPMGTVFKKTSSGGADFDNLEPSSNPGGGGPIGDMFGVGYDGNAVGGIQVPGLGNVALYRWRHSLGFAGVTAHGKPIFRALPVSDRIGVLGAGGAGPNGSRGNNDLVSLMNQLGGTAVYRHYLATAIGDLAGFGHTNINLIGYSRGGTVMVNTAARFSSLSFNIIGIDAVTIGIPGRSISLPSNVVSATNFYQQNPHDYGLGPTGNSFIGTPFSSRYINVNNINLTGNMLINHSNIVGAVSQSIVSGGWGG